MLPYIFSLVAILAPVSQMLKDKKLSYTAKAAITSVAVKGPHPARIKEAAAGQG
jgi:hypothetical protein